MRKLLGVLLVVVMMVCLIPAAQAASYPSVFFYSDEDFSDLIVSDTVTVGSNYPIRIKWFAAYNNEGYDVSIYDNSGDVVATASNTWSNSTTINYITVTWDTTGYKAGDYKVVVEKKFYSLYRWNVAPTVSTLYITLTNNISQSNQSIKNGLTLDGDGVWRYYENGTFVEKTGIVDFQGGQFFVANGVLCADVSGLASYDDRWYFLSNGQIQTQYTGLALYDGSWFFVTNGRFDPALNGLVDYDGSKFIVAAGQVIRGINGLWQNMDGTWYYLSDSQVVTYYTGLTNYDGAWFYVINGRLATEYTGTVEYDGAQFQVVNGMVVM